MTAVWDKLILLLTQNLQIYQALLRLSQKKREVLVAVNPQDLEQLTKQEEMLIIEAGKLEKLRQTLTGELAAALSLPPGQTALAVLIEQAEAETAAKLRAISETFAGVTAELVELNQVNEKLIKQSLDYINYNINILSQSTAEHTYAPKGQPDTGRTGKSMFDAKA
ncbi:flagellar protein FlgN [Sporomusa sphaeroides]|uniref:flagellar protein FlgN n=1 Tax=Sporomusa sphaeroides TaxID=47679 RepID=UPI002C3C40DB|nr:flagellar protein FlgN [Sporomusa sphaeroides]HML34216.1 flagellar protein FlgN [Sporomusa sphaeroides]